VIPAAEAAADVKAATVNAAKVAKMLATTACGKVRVANFKVLQGWEDGIEPAKQAKGTL
jgi:hypothetical protein